MPSGSLGDSEVGPNDDQGDLGALLAMNQSPLSARTNWLRRKNWLRKENGRLTFDAALSSRSARPGVYGHSFENLPVTHRFSRPGILQGDVHNRILLSYKWIMSLTEDDKKWITERLERVETSL